MPLMLALDQGTTSSRAIVFDADGAIRAAAQRELPQHFPRPGWVEHDPAEVWDTQLAVAREALATLGASARDLAAIGIANQRETVLLWDRATGEPVHRAIVWQDRRTAGFCDALRQAGHAERIRDRTGLVIDAYFSASKLRWLLDHVPGAAARAARGELAAGTVDAWLLWKLTGGAVHATDPTNASRTMLYALRAGDWDDELLALFGVPRAVLPRVAPSSGILGETAKDLLGGPIPIAGVAGDQQAALFGQACFDPGRVKTTYGTGCFMLMPTGDAPVASAHQLLSTAAASGDGRPAFALEGSVFVGGAVVQWLRDQLGLIKRSADVEALAATVPDSGGVVLVPAFTGLGAPYWDSSARGTVCGLTRSSSAAHLARAALESIAFQVADLLGGMRADSGAAVQEMRVDGGAAVNDLLMQFQADVLGVPTVRPAVTETTALGAAYLAGLATGVWPDTAALAAHWRAERTFEPEVSADEAQALRARWARAVARARQWEAPESGV